jgi:hypothetical protein
MFESLNITPSMKRMLSPSLYFLIENDPLNKLTMHSFDALMEQLYVVSTTLIKLAASQSHFEAILVMAERYQKGKILAYNCPAALNFYNMATRELIKDYTLINEYSEIEKKKIPLFLLGKGNAYYTINNVPEDSLEYIQNTQPNENLEFLLLYYIIHNDIVNAKKLIKKNPSPKLLKEDEDEIDNVEAEMTKKENLMSKWKFLTTLVEYLDNTTKKVSDLVRISPILLRNSQNARKYLIVIMHWGLCFFKQIHL